MERASSVGLCLKQVISFLYCAKIKTHIVLLFYFGHQTLYGTVLQHDNAKPHAVRHNTQFLANNNNVVQILSWPSMSPDLNPNKHTQNLLERDAFGAERTPRQICVSCFRHSSRTEWPSQRKWFKIWSSPCLRDAGQLLILEGNTCVNPGRNHGFLITMCGGKVCACDGHSSGKQQATKNSVWL